MSQNQASTTIEKEKIKVELKICNNYMSEYILTIFFSISFHDDLYDQIQVFF